MGFKKAFSMQKGISRDTLSFQGNLNVKAGSSQFFLVKVICENMA